MKRAASTCRAQLLKLTAMQLIQISEIFGPTIQGEGTLIGRPTVFVRTGGCDFRCAWCDTLYAVLPQFKDEWRKMSAPEIVAQVLAFSQQQPILVTLSGGNPALQPLESLLDVGREAGCTFALETQGSVAKSWFAKLDYLVLSPKAPSSQMNCDWESVAQCIVAARNEEDCAASTCGLTCGDIALKIVVFDERDYAFARAGYELLKSRFPFVRWVLQVGNPAPEQPENWPAAFDKGAAATARQIEWLLESVARDGWLDILVLPQLHVLLWGNRRAI